MKLDRSNPARDISGVVDGDGSAPRNANQILAATILGSSLAFIDGTVVNVALPILQRDLTASAADVQWVVESYALFLAALILVGGSLGDRFGRRRLYGLGVVIFTLASAVCGAAPNIQALIVARGIQGIGGALLVPGSLAIISSVLPAMNAAGPSAPGPLSPPLPPPSGRYSAAGWCRRFPGGPCSSLICRSQSSCCC
jgi:MFS family permease